MDKDILTAAIDTANIAADAARNIATKYFRTSLHMQTKADNSPVTIADMEIQQHLKKIILARHPEHGFCGEEGDMIKNFTGWNWLIDPIDGTKSFATGNPIFGSLIALLYNAKPMLGIIESPILKERWIGIYGKKSMHNKKVCKTNTTDKINRATIYATTPDMFSNNLWVQFERLSTECRFRVFGGDCLSYGLLASGLVDIVCEAGLKAHDFFALIPIINGAGGVITDWAGAKLTPESNQILATANPELHAQAQQLLTMK